MIKAIFRKNFFYKLLTVAFMTYGCISIISSQMQIANRRAELEALQNECEVQRIANKELERMVSLGDDDEYLERIAREKLDFAYPDERIFIDSSIFN